MKSHVIAGCLVLLQPHVLFAAQPIVDPEDLPRAAAQTDARTQRVAPKKSARVHDAEAAEKDPRHIARPDDRKAHRGSARGLIDPSDRLRRIVQPEDKVRGRLAPGPKPRSNEDAADSQRGDPVNAADPRSATEGGSFGASNFAQPETTSGRRERWRVLAEELALKLVGGCMASLVDPTDGEAADASGSQPAQGSCPVLPRTRSER